MENWYYADAERQRQGPLSAEELAQRFHQGRLRLDTLVWRDGMAEWQPLRDFTAELALHQAPAETFYTPAEPAAAATTAGGTAPAFGESSGDAAGSASPYAPPSAALTSDEAFYAGGEVVYAGFWKRVAAYMIDAMVIGIATQIVQLVVMGVFFGLSASSMSNPETMFASGTGILFVLALYVVPLAMNAAYYAAFHASSKQATLGKMAVGIKVVRTDGTRISLARGVGRFFGTILSSLTIGIGFLMAAFTERKQGLHDMICDTLVVDKWAYTAHPEWQKRELGTVTVVILAIFGVLILLFGAIMVFAMIGIASSMR
ncbi:RDD family protein [Pseudoxanthomonas sacheonensis]|uniref:RDD family protein n=1 Tax=Pseudoxanthomonas sacheonensis TaxID=443615 RepID=UPI0013D23A3A|nr:RDD family protein [Pseudoxanthomonas sacheonensis]KAF1710810.1 transporter [Pseudoxanthomonas sacheonensis]